VSSNLEKISKKGENRHEETKLKGRLVRHAGIFVVSFAGDPFIEPAQEIMTLIARRAHELFESSGFTHGHALRGWLRAESEILLQAPGTFPETETGFAIRADVPVSAKRIWKYELPSFPVHHRQRQEASDAKEGRPYIRTPPRTSSECCSCRLKFDQDE